MSSRGSRWCACVEENPSLSAHFINYLLTRNRRIEQDLIDHMFNFSEKRLARVLLLLAHIGKDGEVAPILEKIGQDTLAEMVGTTRSRVNFFMNKFRKQGHIHYNGGLKVHDSLESVLHMSERKVDLKTRQMSGPGEIVVVVLVWVGLHLNPHPFKTKRVRHPTAGVVGRACCMKLGVPGDAG